MRKNTGSGPSFGTVRYESGTGQRYVLQETASQKGRRLAAYRRLSEEEYQGNRQSGRDGLFMDSLERGHWLCFYQTGSRFDALMHMLSVIGADRCAGGKPCGDFAPAFFPILPQSPQLACGGASQTETEGAPDEY